MTGPEPVVECVLDYAAKTGESPTWSVQEQALYWIDVKQPALHRFDPQTRRDTQWLMPEDIGCFALPAMAAERSWRFAPGCSGSRSMMGL
ncbi:MAG TPA: SMP-30/gluconolactonase/LRE family protein [Steroidobacteraceae bacterium]|nr:SMP-30/gluconolactonase/LRE family protein [Steroidobacteraceae bacterium]